MITMTEYIEREALYEKAYWHGEHPNVDNPFPDGVDAIDIKDVDAIPAADVAPVRHGRWIAPFLSDGGNMCAECSNCHKIRIFDDYCSACGAIMDLNDLED